MQISYAAAGVDDLYCTGLDDGKPLHKPAVLLWRKLNQRGRFPGPLEAPAFNPFVQKNKSIALPEKAFDSITPPSTEQEQ
jgi:hypothetical protein